VANEKFSLNWRGGNSGGGIKKDPDACRAVANREYGVKVRGKKLFGKK
jgi:hypothetical protein